MTKLLVENRLSRAIYTRPLARMRVLRRNGDAWTRTAARCLSGRGALIDQCSKRWRGEGEGSPGIRAMCRSFNASSSLLARLERSNRVASKNSSSRAYSANGDDSKAKADGEAPFSKVGDTLRLKALPILTRHEKIYNLPNLLTFSRLLATPVLGYLIIHDQHAWAVGLLAYASMTDLVDGWIARKWNLQTVIGSVVDPMADKFLMITLVASLAVNASLPIWLATLIFGRDASLGVAAFYYRYASLPPPKSFMRYWDFSLPSAEVHPTDTSKYNTFLQLVLLGAVTALPLAPSTLFGINVNQAVAAMQYLVAATTLWSGAQYTYRKDVVIILGTDEALKRKQGVRGRMIITIVFASFAGAAAWMWTRPKKQMVAAQPLQ